MNIFLAAKFSQPSCHWWQICLLTCLFQNCVFQRRSNSDIVFLSIDALGDKLFCPEGEVLSRFVLPTSSKKSFPASSKKSFPTSSKKSSLSLSLISSSCQSYFTILSLPRLDLYVSCEHVSMLITFKKYTSLQCQHSKKLSWKL